MSTVELDSHAIATLRYIRRSMESAVSIAVPGSAGLVMGAIGIAAASLSMTPDFSSHWVGTWLTAAVLASCAGTALLLRPMSDHGVSLRGGLMQKFAVCLCPPLIAGALITMVLIKANSMSLIPGVWLLLYGAALASASVLTTRMLLLMGTLFGVLGCTSFFVSHVAQMLTLGFGFGGIHLGFGIWLVSHGRQS